MRILRCVRPSPLFRTAVAHNRPCWLLKRWIPRPPPATRRIRKISPARQAGLLAAAALQIFPPAGSSTVFRPHWVQSGPSAVSEREPSQERFLRTQTSEKETIV